jgi:hypothetical protein
MLRQGTTVVKFPSKLASRVLFRGQVVQWEGLLVMEQDPWVVMVGLAIGLAASVGWEERPVEWEQLHVARGEVLVGLGWLIVKQ